MNPDLRLDLRYLGRSGVSSGPGGLEMLLRPNLSRAKVSFDGEVALPVRFREAMSALHDVVIGDLRFKPKDKTAYEEWKKDQERQEAELRKQLAHDIKARELEKIAREPIRPDLEKDFRRMHDWYWRARRQWASELARNDPEMFRALVPCDPVITVADDVVFFECFSKDEASYGCLSVDRGAFRDVKSASVGTTNVDYSLALFESFQKLRTYRPTRLQVDPSGFEVQVAGRADYREEKIDLPVTWLRGFGQIQAAMALPARIVELPVEVVYSLLAHLKRHREKTGPRSLKFVLAPGRPPTVVLEPWGIPVESRGAAYKGEQAEEIKVWGRRRLMSLARILPLAERITVRLLGSGLPSIWVVEMGEMRFQLALSGWTTNDWSAGATLDLLAPPATVGFGDVTRLRQAVIERRRASAQELAQAAGLSRDVATAGLHQLAKEGQVIYDFAADVYRWREVMPWALSVDKLGPPPPEVVEGQKLARSVTIERRELVGARLLVVAKVENTSVEAMFTADQRIGKAKCSCSYFHKNRLRMGPCRHLLALQLAARTLQ
jgi:hypothetical protein